MSCELSMEEAAFFSATDEKNGNFNELSARKIANCDSKPAQKELKTIQSSSAFFLESNELARKAKSAFRKATLHYAKQFWLQQKKMFLRWQFLKSKPGVHLPCAMQKDPLTMLCNDMKCAREHKALNAKRTPNGNFSFISQFRVHRNCQKADLMIVKHEKEKKRLQKRYPAERKFHVGFYAKRRKGKERRKSRGKKRMKNAKCIIKCSTENY